MKVTNQEFSEILEVLPSVELPQSFEPSRLDNQGLDDFILAEIWVM